MKYIASLTGGNGGGSRLQDILNQFAGGGGTTENTGGGIDIQDLIDNYTCKVQDNFQPSGDTGGGDGLMDKIKGFLSK